MAAYIKADLDKCVGCGLCLRGCASNAISIKDGKAAIDADACVLCRICIDSCPLGALTLESDSSDMSDTSRHSGIFVFAECRNGQPEAVAFELVYKARLLAQKLGDGKVTAVVLGQNAAQAASNLLEAGADRALYSQADIFAKPLELPYTEAICRLTEEYLPEILLFGATPFGRSLAPRVAARLGCGLTADCTVLDIDPEKGLLLQTRPAFGGNLMATIICPDRRPQMATVRPGVFPKPEGIVNKGGRLIPIDLMPQKGPVEILSEITRRQQAGIKEARIIVSAGRGVGSQKNMALIDELAGLLGASVGVSRPLVDMGWADYSCQIGQTGCSVSPDLLICFGISGAIQHLAGIGGAKTVIAVNSDPEAPIFANASYKAVGDCIPIIKEIIAQLKSTKQ